ncbi:hypothetical protein VTK26DRAFT_3918 [Humicola hyalothermophila]
MAARWGSFLSQAVAGVEARLDNILAESDESPAQQQQPEQKDTKSPPAPASPARSSPGPSRATSNARPNDRLQERLARAMAAKSAGRTSMSTPGSPRQSLDAQSRNSTDSADRPSPTVKDVAKDTYASPRSSQDIARQSQDGSAAQLADRAAGSANGEESRGSIDGVNGARSSADVQAAVTSPPSSVPAMTATEPKPQAKTLPTSNDTVEEGVSEADKTADRAQVRHQEEIHSYVERIDALEAKLQFLAREATESARKAALAAPAGSVEKKLAEKDQQIAQLMDEGKNLAATEQKHRTILKKQRATIADYEKELNALRAARDKSNKEMEGLRDRAHRADELEKAQDDLQKRFDQAQKELSTLRPENRSKDSTIAELRAKLQRATEQADAMAAKVNEQGREQDRRRIAELEEEVAALQVEKNLVADRGKAQAAELREKAERANERARALELELKAEVQVMEGKLEAMRIRAEEASSGAAGDTQAKLLRQVETLQTQYSIASENWQGIETTLLARITSLEKERDEALQRESEMRKKAREAAIRAKRHEEELEEAKTKIPSIQEDVKSYQAQLDSLKKRAEEAEAALAKATAEFEKQKQAWEAEKEERQSRPVLERPRSWLEDLPGSSFLKQAESRPASPQLVPPQRTFSTDFLGIQHFTSGSKGRKVSTPYSNSEAGGPEPRGPSSFFSFSRRPSAQPPVRPTLAPSQHGSTSGGGGGGIFSPLSLLSPSSDTPPSQPPSQQQLQLQQQPPPPPSPLVDNRDRNPGPGPDPADALFNGVETSSSPPPPQQQEIMSVSTVAAGPSVQLVERMSAAIRRLESERLAAREELARISRQRDEARAEIVALMREVEHGKAAAARLGEVEREVAEVRERYETTLELLGEKSEEVEELKADVEDVKAMYRDLVERTVK